MKKRDSQQKTDDGWLRVAAAADLLGVSASTIRRWSDSGELHGHRTPGGHRRYRRDELDLLLSRTPAMRAPSTAAGRRDADASVPGADPAPRARRAGAAALDAAAWQSYDALLGGIIVIDAESHVIVAANAAAAELIGADRDDIVGRECH